MNNKHAERVPFSIQLMNFIGVVAKAFGFILIYMGIGGMMLQLLSSGPHDIENLSEVQKESLKTIYIIAQFAGAFIGLIVLPVLYILFLREDLKNIFLVKKGQPLLLIGFAMIIFFSFLPLVNAVNEWNQSLHLPAILKTMEGSLRTMEDQAAKAIDIIIYYDNVPQFLVIFFLVAILPAVGEELLFRGIVQNEISQIFRNPHTAIFLSAFLFSFVHFQFFGFFPRMLLGILFGYLYYWSGNLLIPISIHCFNNGLTLINMNMLKEKKTEIDLSSTQSLSPTFIIFSLVISVVLLYIYRQVSLKFNKEDERMAENI
jgi:uncharacterized protein